MTSTICVYGSSEMEQLGKQFQETKNATKYNYQEKDLTLICCCAVGLELGEDDEREVKRPKKLALFDMSNGGLQDKVPIVSISVGGQHSAVLTPQGRVYTWGCNDEGALGRDGVEDKPLLVDLPSRVDGVATGDNHTIFYKSGKNSKAFYCGRYRVSPLLGVVIPHFL